MPRLNPADENEDRMIQLRLEVFRCALGAFQGEDLANVETRAELFRFARKAVQFVTYKPAASPEPVPEYEIPAPYGDEE